MKLEDLKTVDQLTSFLSGTQSVAFSVISDKDECYCWIQGELVKFRYLSLSRQEKRGGDPLPDKALSRPPFRLIYGLENTESAHEKEIHCPIISGRAAEFDETWSAKEK